MTNGLRATNSPIFWLRRTAAAGGDFMESDRTRYRRPHLALVCRSVGLGKEFYDRSQGKPFSSKIWLPDLAGAMTGALIGNRCPDPPQV